MKIVRFSHNNQITYGLVEGDIVKAIKGTPYSKIVVTGERFSIDKVEILPPCKPQKIICLGLNYSDHAEEVGLDIPKYPVIFLKPQTTIVGHGEEVVLAKMSRRNDFEAELAFVIKKKARNVPEEKAKEYILGYTCANDVTARSLQPKDGQWTISKSFDTYCPIGPCIANGIDINNLKIEMLVNGEVKQSSNTGNLIFKPEFLVSYLSKVMTLMPGDIILTGTPSGIGKVEPGDVMTVRIEGIGDLVNQCVAEK